MDTDEIRLSLVEALRAVAPEVEQEDLRPELPLRDQVDLDSMDWLNFLTGLKKSLGVDVPEADYSRLNTLDDMVRYVQDKHAT
ncbi:phosphopantetheine-binding protein [Rhodococcus sp. WMMA185]|uniref:acyl carrier protein n=1 Tax=Rhodococcus sp. WMMA185 TaxID=679318 RepID=UPI000877F98A|nr:acyl carrier protein [Rhodococcus sp. WMMA185]AOW93617.1 phosphopantetheine-binding protein [Rhodococcus sp. WMMA185]